MNDRVKLVGDVHPNIIRQLKQRGIFRCHCIIPPCSGWPYAEVADEDDTRHLFCRDCTKDYCIRHGLTFPMPPEKPAPVV